MVIRETNLYSKGSSSIKDLLTHIEANLEKFDADSFLLALKKQGINASPLLKWKSNDFYFNYRLMPIEPQYRKKKRAGFIGMSQTETFWGGGERELNKAIAKKSSRYGQLDKPLILFLNFQCRACSFVHDIETFFPEATNVSKASHNYGVNGRPLIFGTSESPKHKNCSAVFITDLFDYNIYSAKHFVKYNPYAIHSLEAHCIEANNFLNETKPGLVNEKIIFSLIRTSESYQTHMQY